MTLEKVVVELAEVGSIAAVVVVPVVEEEEEELVDVGLGVVYP